ncbi:Cytochrome P450 [Alloactinosynnema sp. L-07]|uniref:cytochrome P450 n=1 Tax=Alloactinosynnema sp. L-07 TaxID=1653480 RepID=UPI00065EF441|nr:cytochrome P450 [Alloactinosynnema sp. L-07]CRK55959.1 Cytochrome P450 [Alloactinosynnema sp. L-07]
MTTVRKVERWLSDRPWPTRELSPTPPDSRPVLGDAGLPVLGHTLSILRQGVDFGLRRYERYGPVSWISSFGTKFVTASGPEAAQVVLTNKDKAYSQQGWTFFIGPFFRGGLMLMDFEEHLQHRRLMQHAFTQDRISAYNARVADIAEREIREWPARDGFLVYPALKQLTLDVATDIFMATSGRTDALREAFIDTVRAGTSLVRYPVPGGRWAAGLRGRKVLEAYFREAVPRKRASVDDDLFSALCHARTDEGDVFSDDDIVNHMIFLMMAAHDTSTITTTAALYFLGKDPVWQERARAESMAVDEITTSTLDSLTSLDLIIRESMRLVSPVPSLARQTVRDTDLLGHHVPAGTKIAVSTWVNHLLPEYWPDPTRFDPLRFAEDRREDKVHRYAWMPFGGGVHKCIGMHFGMYEVKTLLHELLRMFRWSVPEGYQVRWDPTALPVPTDDLPIRLTRL